MKRVRLHEIAKTIRSKNAGVDRITFDVICRDHSDFDLIRRSSSCYIEVQHLRSCLA